ncbi:MAG TPA: hypothetical protein PLW07_04645 [bacterium]|nr:hypothetical protein [bacterium]
MKKQQRLLKKYYHRRMQAAKKQLQEFEQGNRPFEKLNRRAKKLLQKRIKAGYELPARLFIRHSTQ